MSSHVSDLKIRYANAIAATCGLGVSIEVARSILYSGNPRFPCYVWRGTAEQFKRLWFVPPGEHGFAGMKKMRHFTPGWLRGHLYRDGKDTYRYVIEYGHVLTRQMENRIARRATEDVGYQRFRQAMLAPVEVD